MSDKLYPVSDADIKALRDKSEDDTNSYSKINKTFISKLKATKETLEDKSSPMKEQRLFDRMLSKKKEAYEKKKY